MQASSDMRSHGKARREARTAAIRSTCRLAAHPSSSSAMPQVGGERVQHDALCGCIGAQHVQAGLAAGADRNLRTGAGKRQRHFTTDALAAAGDPPAAAAVLTERRPAGDPIRCRGCGVVHHRSNLMPWASGSESE
ncbi:hypothetical protein G6F24_016791 [Rhizopus arrhizus]|nr:hypothetical protein G6F24_016791 [Rhizopus arrhizus]